MMLRLDGTGLAPGALFRRHEGITTNKTRSKAPHWKQRIMNEYFKWEFSQKIRLRMQPKE
jgi:hypothetical protein